MQYGISCAHLYMRQSISALPGAAVACARSARELAAAYAEVEAGRLEDHTKLKALRALLTAFATVKPVRKCRTVLHVRSL